jgi:hypothetical protein
LGSIHEVSMTPDESASPLISIQAAHDMQRLDCRRLAAQALIALAHGADPQTLTRERYESDIVGHVSVTGAATAVEQVRRLLSHAAVDLLTESPGADDADVMFGLDDILFLRDDVVDAVDEAQCDLESEWRASVHYVRTHWQHVVVIGDALVRRKSLAADEIAVLIANLPPPARWTQP